MKKGNELIEVGASSERQLYSVNGEFEWTPEREEAALLLATGHTVKETAQAIEVCESTLYNWKKTNEFAMTVDELSLMHGAASKAYRMQLINMALRTFVKEKADGSPLLDMGSSELLDWIKEARMQTDGERLNLAPLYSSLAEEARSVARSGSAGSDPHDGTEPDGTE